MINLFRLSLIAIVTAILGTLGILSCLVIPSGDGVILLARLWARLLLGLCRVRVVVRGAEKIRPPGPYVFLSNHQSQFDIPAAVMAIPVQFRILAKKELFHIPIFGWALRLSGFVGIERSNREKAIRSLDEAARPDPARPVASHLRRGDPISRRVPASPSRREGSSWPSRPGCRSSP